MNELKTRPFCGGIAEQVIMLNESGYDSSCRIECNDCKEGSDIYELVSDAVEAWNKRNDFEVPDGYIVLPATKLDEPKPVIFNTDNGIESRYDFSEVVRKYSEYIANRTDYEILTKTLNRAGWFKERTCKNLATRKDDFACSECNCEVVGCMVDEFGSFDNPLCFSYCPGCGAKVMG